MYISFKTELEHSMLRVACPANHRLKVQFHLTYRTLATMTSPYPVILCGKTEAIGAVVIENLKPEFEGTITRLSVTYASEL